MFDKSDLIKINDYLWEIPRSYRKDMQVPARIYASEKILQGIEEDALRQVINVAALPGIVKYSLAMPDIHSGYGFAIGGVAATKYPEGVISPGGIGYDQNCGCRVLLSHCQEQEISSYLDKLAAEIQKQVPSGLGRGRQIKLSIGEINKILERGVPYLVEKGYGEEADIENCEEKGKMKEADALAVSLLAKRRGCDQVGTLGSGNHFIEIQKVTEIFDKEVSKVFGLFKGQVTVMIHTGSRGLGHQNCTDYLKMLMRALNKYAIKLPDRELACVPFNSPEGQRFFRALGAACNFAWANRQMISYYIRQAWQKVLSKKMKLNLLYDVAHNIAKIEKYKINDEQVKLIVHRKGATRAFPPGHLEIPERYREVGQPVLIPGSMGTASYVLVGTKEGKEAFYSSCHGAGRTMSRHEAIRRISGQEVVKSLESKGIIVKCSSTRGIAEEAPIAYKNVEEVVEIIHNAGLSKKVAKLVPIAVIKGE